MNRLIIGAVTALSLGVTTMTYGQHTNFNTQRNWSLNKKEVIFGVGLSQFLGDLGGKDLIGKDYSMRDMDWPSTHFGGMVGFRYRFHPYWATTTSLYGGMLKGSDSHTNELIRNSRNLHFRSIALELSQRIEFIVLANEKFGARLKIKGLKHAKTRNEQVYLFAGIGAMYYNPQARYQGQWTNLRPLKTEGQGLTNGPKPYGFVTATIPMGIGLRMGIGEMWRMGIEATYIKTFSDYIDDVGGSYYDPAILASEVGQESAFLSNPSYKNTTWFAPGEQRGDKQKDAYFTLNVVFYKNITYKNYNSSRNKSGFKGGRYKF